MSQNRHFALLRLTALHPLLIFAALASGGQTAEASQTAVSGYEVFKGISFGSTTIGATFAGWTNAGGWQ